MECGEQRIFQMGGLCHVANRHFDCLAKIAPSGEIPAIGEVLALLWFDCLNGTVVTFQKEAGSVRLIYEGQSFAIRTQTRVILNELIYVQMHECRDGLNLFLRHSDKSRPAAACCASLAEIGRWHGDREELKRET